MFETVYRNADSVYRYIYGYSYESDKRNLAGPIKASAIYMNISLAVTSLVAGIIYLLWVVFLIH